MLTYDEICQSFEQLRRDFHSKSAMPFYRIDIRPATKLGERQPLTMTNFKRRLNGLPLKLGNLLPDESEYIAVITLECWTTGIKPYTFKIRPDGAFLRVIPFEYKSQPIGKWTKFINNFIQNLPRFGSYLRQLYRTRLFRDDLIRTFAEKSFHHSLTGI